MEFTPHAIHSVLTRLREQIRCPQCGTRLPVELQSIKVAGDGFLLLQLKCASCSAFIVLHVNVSDPKQVYLTTEKQRGALNASSRLRLTDEEVSMLKNAIEQHGGSFEKMFGSDKQADDSSGGQLSNE